MAIQEQTVSGIKWTTVATVNNAAVQMLKLFILARLLHQTDFGLIAIALMVIGFTEIFSNLGLSVGLIHKQEISQQQYSSVYWLNLIASVLIYGILCAVTPLLVRFYHEPTLGSIIPLLGLQLIINAFGKIFYTFKTKELEFKFISIVNIVSVLSGAILTVILALYNFGVFSLVYGMLFQALAMQLTYALSGWRKYKILFHFRIHEITDLVKIGGYQVGTQVLDYCASKLDVFLIGRFFGMELLGIYNLAKELISKLIQVINPIITNVATPAFAKFQDNLPLIQNSYLRILHILSSINFPIFFILALFAEPVTLFLYGEKMMGIAIFIRILSVWGLLNSIGNPAGILMVSLGRTDLGFYWTILRISVTTIAILIAGQISINAVAYSQVIIAFLFFFIYWRMMIFNMAKINLYSYILANAKPFVFSAIAGILILPVILFCNMTSPWQWIGIVFYGLIYISCQYLFNRPVVNELWNLIFTKE